MNGQNVEKRRSSSMPKVKKRINKHLGLDCVAEVGCKVGWLTGNDVVTTF